MKFDAYVTFKSPEDAQLAISKLDGLEVKKTVLKVALAQADEKKNREVLFPFWVSVSVTC